MTDYCYNTLHIETFGDGQEPTRGNKILTEIAKIIQDKRPYIKLWQSENISDVELQYFSGYQDEIRIDFQSRSRPPLIFLTDFYNRNKDTFRHVTLHYWDISNQYVGIFQNGFNFGFNNWNNPNKPITGSEELLRTIEN